MLQVLCCHSFLFPSPSSFISFFFNNQHSPAFSNQLTLSFIPLLHRLSFRRFFLTILFIPHSCSFSPSYHFNFFIPSILFLGFLFSLPFFSRAFKKKNSCAFILCHCPCCCPSSSFSSSFSSSSSSLFFISLFSSSYSF